MTGAGFHSQLSAILGGMIVAGSAANRVVMSARAPANPNNCCTPLSVWKSVYGNRFGEIRSCRPTSFYNVYAIHNIGVYLLFTLPGNGINWIS